jgi:hypothetical protein
MQELLDQLIVIAPERSRDNGRGKRVNNPHLPTSRSNQVRGST